MSTASNNTQGMPGMVEIIELARLLRQNGDKVLSATSKLSLTTSLLNDLNEAFSLIVDENEDLEISFQVCNSSTSDIFRDLKFLHDFVQKTVSLKITHRQKDRKTLVDITKFRHLKYLELQKVSIESVHGLQGIRGQLESVVCSGGRGVGSVGRLLAACGGDAGVGFLWGSLRSLALPYNALVRLDKSLELATWLQTLDLSHNLISSATEINCLPNLKNVNLGYNKLETVPTFSQAVFHTLQVVILKNNYIDNLSGLQGLDFLSELDLSYNCLTEHSVLWPLESMSALLWISLEGNPLSYHPKHRLLSIKHLHPSIADSKFVLDHILLSKVERQVVNENRFFSIRPTRFSSGDDLSSLTSSVRSDLTSTSIETTMFTESMIQSQYSDPPESVRSSKGRKKTNVTVAVIAGDDCDKDEITLSSSIASSIETSMDHLETKKQIVALREKFGADNWLHSHAATFVQEIMGMQNTSRPLLSSTPVTMTPIDTPRVTTIYDSSTSKLDTSTLPVDASVEIESIGKFGENKESLDIPDEKEKDISDKTDLLVSKIVEVTTDSQLQSEGLYDPDEEEGDIYIVQKKKTRDETEELFLIVTPKNIKEKDSITRRVICRWATNTVLSCVMGRGETTSVDIIFDTSRRDRQNRTYFMEPHDAKQLVATVGEVINAQPITLKVFKCMKCSTHFSEDSDNTLLISAIVPESTGPKCPTCKSTLVIQTDELATPVIFDDTAAIKGNESNELSQDQLTKAPKDQDLEHSASHSSIGSATSLDESRESTPSAGTMTKKYESDIEILSNPSQSSIEVLDENAKSNLTPSRKRSSEERRVAVAPSLLTIPDTSLLPAGLTESSSSGSLTDSVCTAYENKALKLIEPNLKSTKTYREIEQEVLREERESTPQSSTNLSAMLGGLLETLKIGTSKLSSPILETDPVFSGSAIQYSYTDYRSVDHRVKLHIILNIFEHEKEDLVLLLRAEILAKDSAETFPGCLILSTSKVYILRITGSEGEDPQKWLQKECSWTMDRLRTFAPLPFKQGILVELYQPGKVGEGPSNATVVCILQDFQRTSNFLSYLTDLPLPGSCEVEFSVPEHCTSRLHHLLTFSENHQDGDAVRLLALFSCCTIKYDDQTIVTKVAGLIITMSALLVIEDNLQWLVLGSQETPAIKTEQPMSNLISVEHNGSLLKLSYLDELANKEEIWTLEFVSSGAVETVINSIQPPWEELFSVPLQITSGTSPDTLKT
ncbi:serine/threonine-protein kinase 11-interacting protein isoform X2 [Athalia rosae]|uniref:serine/threonine-protein kinase 11-interacting protein isoform X2 n=1 Tax=Athalia rosae TaxID=37344 RepID=UPI0020349188|nr:serine/threonine-protein kinase 11-interacting protein isoform X2 [Athalia rosae]